MGKKDFRSAEKITTVARTRKKPRFGPWMTSPLEARRVNVLVVYMAQYMMVLRRARSITRGIGRGGPWNGYERSPKKSFLSFAASSPSFLFLNRLITVSPFASFILYFSSFIFYSPKPSLSSSLYILCMYAYRLFLLDGLLYLSPESVVWQWTWKTLLWIFQPYISVKENAFFTEGREQDPSILWHSGIWGAADEALLNIVHKEKKEKNPPCREQN